MTKYLLIFFLFTLLSFIPNSGKCTHIVGGELYYEHQGNNVYKVILKVYRDCLNGQVGFDDPASIGIFNSNGILVEELLISNPVITTIPVSVDNPCLVVPPVICTEEGIYTGFVTLPNLLGGYDLVYQRCCRNNIIQNINNPDVTGSTYISHIPEQSVVAVNSAPHFSNLPPLVLCNGEDFVFDHSAIDPDGDVLVYEFCNPYHGASDVNPMPQPPNTPPYSNVTWSGGYSTNTQIQGTPGLQINSSTGELTCTPSSNGIYVVGICVKEYRNGVLINSTLRDYQFTVVTCSQNIISAVPSQNVLCDGYTVSFTNQSTNSSFYHWDFGVLSTLNDTSNLTTPTFTYPDTGTYEVILIANPGWPCADTSIASYWVQYPIQGIINPVIDQCITGNNYNFEILGNFTSLANITWDFGPALPATSTLFTQNNVSFTSPGSYTVLASIVDRGCSRDFTIPLEIYAQPIASVPDLIICDNLTSVPINNTTNATTYEWDFGDPSTTSDGSTLQSPSYTYPQAGNYTATLYVNNSNMCFDTTTALLTVRDTINIIIDSVGAQCFLTNNFTFSTTGALPPGATFEWDFGLNSTPSTSTFPNPTVSFSQPGNQLILFTVTDGLCIESIQEIVSIITEPEAILLPDTICDGPTVSFTNLSANATNFYWDFGDLNINSDTSNFQAPIYTYTNPGLYTVTLIAEPNAICPDTTRATFLIKEPLLLNFTTLSPQCLTNNSFDFTLTGNYSSNAQYNWLFGANAIPTSSISENPTGITFNQAGDFLVTIEIIDESCQGIFFDSISIYPEPQIGFEIASDTGCAPFTIQFSDTSAFDGSADFLWDFGDGNTSTDQFPIHEYLTPGSYTVSYSLNTHEGCIQNLQLSFSNLITVLESPVANFSITTPSIIGISQITDQSLGNFSSQFFIIEGDTIYSSDFEYTFQGIGEIEVINVTVNDLGCSDTARTIVEVTPEDLIYIPNSFTPNGDNINDVFQVYVYGAQTFELKIFDRWGQLFYAGNQNSAGWDGTLNGKHVQNDVYVWRVSYADYYGRQTVKYGHVSVIR